MVTNPPIQGARNQNRPTPGSGLKLQRVSARDPADDLVHAVDRASLVPLPPGPEGPTGGSPAGPRWWGNHLRELRWQAELARLLVDPVYRGENIPRGSGEPVILIPGFLAGDSSLAILRGWLARIGYRPFAAGMQVNIRCSDQATDRLDARLERIHASTGRRVALIGHSRGGHFAKALAHRRPERVSTVVSMGAGLDAPFDISVPTKLAVGAMRTVHARTTDRVARRGCFTDSCDCQFSRDYGAAFPSEVPLTSIYSKQDGVVRWPACVVSYAHSVEVTGSHIGLAFNRKVYRVLADTLAAQAGRA